MDTTTAAPLPSRGFKSTLFVRDDFGVMLSHRMKVHALLPGGHKPGKRGKVKGFSRRAAERLRNFLFTLDYPGLFSGHPCFGLALTCPPWVACSVEEVFDGISKHKSRCPGLLGLVWRKEVTRRGQPHYHLIVWCDGSAYTVGWLIKQWCGQLERRICPARLYLSRPDLWEKVKNLGKPPSAFVGSWLRSVHESKRNLTIVTSSTAVQYLCDHTSKHKRYQALTTGRAWGVWFKDRLPRIPLAGVDLEQVPDNVLARIQRALRKMSRYWWPDKSAPFGYRWSRGRDYRFLGRHALFRPGAAVAVQRLLACYCPGAVSRAGDGADVPGRTRRTVPARETALPSKQFGSDFHERSESRADRTSVGATVDRAPFLPGMDPPSCIMGSYSPHKGENPPSSSLPYHPRKRPRRPSKRLLLLRSGCGSLPSSPHKGVN